MPPTGPTTPRSEICRRGWSAALVAMIAVAALTSCSGSSADDDTDDDLIPVVPSGTCDNEVAAVRGAKRAWPSSGDLDGDGSRDSVYLATDRDGEPDCRTFLVVDTGDAVYSAAASVPDHPEATGAAVFRLVQLGGSDGAEVVFSAYESRVDALAVYRIFTFTGNRLQAVAGPHSELVDDPAKPPVGAGCLDGRLVISEASSWRSDRRRTVERRFFTLRGAALKPLRQGTRTIPPGTVLTAALPEFTRPLFGGC